MGSEAGHRCKYPGFPRARLQPVAAKKNTGVGSSVLLAFNFTVNADLCI